jgi:hypothetical protein
MNAWRRVRGLAFLAMPARPPPVASQEQRPFGALADGQADRAGSAGRERDGDDLTAVAGDDQGAVAAPG